MFIAAPENADSSGKPSVLKAISAAVFSAITFSAHAIPEGGQVTSGNAEIKPVVDNTLTINQKTEKASISWQRFSTTSAESIVFNQPGSQSIILNRVIGAESSALLGKMTANGQVWLLNPNGVLMGSGASVNVGGLLATSLFISDSDFINDKKTFSGNGGNVINRGNITAGEKGSGGYVALLGGSVSNEGFIAAKLGTVVLAGGNEVTLDFSGDKLLSARVDKGTVNALAQNKQLISADGGTVIMTSKGVNALLTTVVNNEGTIEARTLEGKKGKMSLIGGNDGGKTTVSGKLDASVIGSGDGGLIDLSGVYIKIADTATITSAASTSTGKSGQLQITTSNFTLSPSGTNTESGMSAAALKANLVLQNVSIYTDVFGNIAAGDISINDAVSWSNNNTLVLNAGRHLNVKAPLSNSGATSHLVLTAKNKININSDITSTGNTASLTITPGNGVDDGYWLNNSAQINLPSGANVKVAGQTYKVINTLEALQGMNDNILINYVLGNDIDATSTKNFNNGKGFKPIADYDFSVTSTVKPFNGNFDGFGHQIKNLTINRTQSNGIDDQSSFIGLFGITANSSILRNVSLVDVDIKGGGLVGSLVGSSQSNINNVFISGKIAGTFNVGGLTGNSDGHINNVSVNVNVTGEQYTGGLTAVLSSTGSINNVSVTGTVIGTTDVGGIAGSSYGVISNSIVNAEVTGTDINPSNTGLVVGQTLNSITNIYATGLVNTKTQSNDLLVGSDLSDFFNGKVTNLNALNADQFKQKENFNSLDFAKIWRIYDGNTSPMLRSFLKPIFISADSFTKIYDKNLYADAVTGINYSIVGATLNGKLAYGDNSQSLVNAGEYGIGGLWSTAYDISYGSGKLTILPKVLTATVERPVTKNYDGNTAAEVVLNKIEPTGLLDGDQIQVKNTGITLTGLYNSKNVNEANKVEILLSEDKFIATGTPLSNYKLVVNGTISPAVLSVTAESVTKPYDGLGYIDSYLAYTGFKDADNKSMISGKIGYDGTEQSVKNVGTYRINSGDLSLTNYTINFTQGTLTIIPRNLTAVLRTSPTKSYDGTTIAKIAASDLKLEGIVVGEKIEALSTTVTGLYNSKDVSKANMVAIGISDNNFSFTNGALAANYQIPPIDGAKITSAELQIKANDVTKTYDGSKYVIGNNVTYDGFARGESSADLIGTLSYAGDVKNAGTYSITPEGFSSTNYNIKYLSGSLKIYPKTLTVNTATVGSPSKSYDGTADANVKFGGRNLVGLVGDDSINIKSDISVLKGSYENINVSDKNKITIGLNKDYFDISESTNTANYQIISVGKITPVALTIKAMDEKRSYNGLAYLGGNGLSYTGFVNNETASVLSGTVSYGGTAQNAKNAGEYVITASGLTSTNYKLDFQPGALKIEPKVLTASFIGTPTKIYDGTANAVVQLSDLKLSGFENNELISVKNKNLTGFYKSKNVSDVNPVTVALTADNFTASEGTQLSNYILQPNNGKITRAPLTVQVKNVVKSFDGLAYSGADLNYIGFVNDEKPAVLDGSLRYGGTAQGAKYPGRYTITSAGLSSSNYEMNFLPGRLIIEPDFSSLSIITKNITSSTAPVGPAKSQYSLRGSTQTRDSVLKIECRQLSIIRFGKAQCVGS